MLDALAAAGVTQTELSRLIGTSQAAISRMARGVTTDPVHSVGDALARVYRDRLGAEAPLLAVCDQKQADPSAVRSSAAMSSVAPSGDA